MAQGSMGLWQLDMKEYFGEDDVIDPVRIVATLNFDVTDNDPLKDVFDGNRVLTDLDMQGHSIINLGSLDWHDAEGKQHKGLIIHADTGSIEVNPEEFGDMKNRVASGVEVEGAKTVSGNTLPGGNPLSYELNPAGTSVMKDIRIENLGGAALSDVMPKLSLMAVHRDVGLNGFVPAPGFKVNAASTGLERDTDAKTCPVGYAPALNVVPKTMASGVNQTGSVATAKNENCTLQGTGSDSCMILRGPQGTCSSGTLSGTSCISSYTSPRTGYTCSSGSLSGVNCVSTNTSPLTGYTCSGVSGGGTLSGSQCRQTQAATRSSYSCPSGGTLSGTNCITTSSSSYPATCTSSPCTNPTHSCRATYGKSPTQIVTSTCPGADCAVGSTYPHSCANAATNYYMAGKDSSTFNTCGTNRSGSATCASIGLTSADAPCGEIIVNFGPRSGQTCTCPSGGTPNGSNCTTSSSGSYPATPNYTCSSGWSLSGTTCTKNVAANPQYTCASGYTPAGTTTSAHTCTYTVSATPQYTCNSGDTPSGATNSTHSCTHTVAASFPLVIKLNSCPFTAYASPPSPWKQILANSASVTGGTDTTYIYQNSNPDRQVICEAGTGSAVVPPDFKGAAHMATPQSLAVGGVTYTSGWEMTAMTGYSAVDASVYCRYVPESLH
jgi:hypothetical protein